MNSDSIGSINDMSIAEARRAQAGEQATFDAFGGNGETTYVAVTRSPDDGLEEAVDYVFEDLGPPAYLLNEFLNIRKDYREQGYSKVKAHNKAWEEIDYHDRFSRYLWWDDSDTESWDEKNNGHEPRSAILDILDMIEAGENIVLVCYCTDEMECHRKLVRSDIEQWKRIMLQMKEEEPKESGDFDEMLDELGINPGEESTQLELSDI